jgi:hypothetical protein
MRTRRSTAFVAGPLAVIALSLAACSGSPARTLPTLRGAVPQGTNSTQYNAAALHAAAQCIRDHGIPDYADPVVAPGNVVYSDARALENADRATVDSAEAACRTLLAQAKFDPSQRPAPPPQMLRDGVREAACLRAHGLPNWPDPDPHDGFDPGHGFQVSGSAFAGAVPAGDNPKASAAYQNARQACVAEVDAVLRDSQLANLARGQ